jgi:hypothetical protein
LNRSRSAPATSSDFSERKSPRILTQFNYFALISESLSNQTRQVLKKILKNPTNGTKAV